MSDKTMQPMKYVRADAIECGDVVYKPPGRWIVRLVERGEPMVLLKCDPLDSQCNPLGLTMVLQADSFVSVPNRGCQ